MKEQIKIENKSKSEYDKMMRLKPSVYKNIPDKKKYDIKFAYDHDKTKREMIEERLKELMNMTPIEYLNKLNEDTKQKLIGLCLNKKILELFENDGQTKYDDDNEHEIDDAEEDSEEEEEEDEDIEEIE